MLLLAGCATTSEEARLEETCRSNLESDPRCIDLLTTPEYESKAQVMAHEDAKEAKAFEDRLTRLRREEEERQLSRARSATVTADLDPESMEAIAKLEEKDDDLPEETFAEAKLDPRTDVSDVGGSSVRAITKREPLADPTVLPKPRPIAKLPAAVIADPPTPEVYLRGARCVVTADVPILEKAFGDRRKAKQDVQGVAVAIIDAKALLEHIDLELAHRRLGTNGSCAQQAPIVDLLRSLVGEPSALSYGNGLLRLRKELEVRAGLPPSE
jgi:hypothetical protein